MLNKGLRGVCLNSNTTPTKRKEVEKEFDAGNLDFIIGGVAVIEAMSIYRLSFVINAMMTSGINKEGLSISNAPRQLMGRLKRVNDAVCAKQKVFIHIVYGGGNRHYAENAYTNGYTKEDIVGNKYITCNAKNNFVEAVGKYL